MHKEKNVFIHKKNNSIAKKNSSSGDKIWNAIDIAENS